MNLSRNITDKLDDEWPNTGETATIHDDLSRRLDFSIFDVKDVFLIEVAI